MSSSKGAGAGELVAAPMGLFSERAGGRLVVLAVVVVVIALLTGVGVL